jgi:hypothetical protein
MSSLCFYRKKLLISGKFKSFRYNYVSNSLEIIDGHFLNGTGFDYINPPDNVQLLKINNLELKYDEINGKITVSKEVIGSSITLEPYNKISSYLKSSNGYFNEELKLVDKEKAVKVQTFYARETDKFNYSNEIPPSFNKNRENSNNIFSIEGLPIAPNLQEFQIILDGSPEDYASQFEGEFRFYNESYNEGDIFKLVKVDNKLTLYSQLYGYLGRRIGERDTKYIMNYKEIPDNLVYLEKSEDSGIYLMRCSGGESDEDDYLSVYWPNYYYGFIIFVEKKEEASIFQFVIYNGYNTEKASHYLKPASKI